MANTLLTWGGITRKAIQLFRNSNAFLQMIDRQYDGDFGRSGQKIGNTLTIRLPNDYVTRVGQVASPQNTVENKTTLVVGTQYGVDTTFPSADLALSMDDFAYRVLGPMVNDLAGSVAGNIMTGVEQVPNFVQLTSAGATITPTSATWLQAGAILDVASCPRVDRVAVLDAFTMSRTVNNLTGLFNPNETISKQYKTGMITESALGFDWSMDQSTIIHTEGSFVSGTVNGANQTGNTLTVNAITGTLNAGDIITIANVYSVNRITKASTGMLQQFVITANASGGATSLSIYPAITPSAPGTPVAYGTVTVSPANTAAITSPIAANQQYRKNLVFHPTACTMATADLDLPTGAVVNAAREAYDGISLRMIRDFNSTTDQWLTRLDILFGWCWPRPEWAVVVADQI